MKLHITRHGQPILAGLGLQDNHQFPPADPELTELGQHQAELLGRELKRLGFQGTIHSSPYRRTLHTASIIADIVDTRILPAVRFQECVFGEGYPTFEGLNEAAIRARYPRVEFPEPLPEPWFVEGPEDNEALERRVQPLLNRLIADGEDVLLVGHGATVFVAINLMMTEAEQLQVPDRGYNWNCALTSLEIAPDGRCRAERFRTAAHLPKACVTANLETLETVGLDVETAD